MNGNNWLFTIFIQFEKKADNKRFDLYSWHKSKVGQIKRFLLWKYDMLAWPINLLFAIKHYKAESIYSFDLLEKAY